MGIRLFTPEQISERAGIGIDKILWLAYAGYLDYFPCTFGCIKHIRFSFLQITRLFGEDYATELFAEEALDAGGATNKKKEK